MVFTHGLIPLIKPVQNEQVESDGEPFQEQYVDQRVEYIEDRAGNERRAAQPYTENTQQNECYGHNKADVIVRLPGELYYNAVDKLCDGETDNKVVIPARS